ncbi:MAG: single-stranded DNA-binding protein [Leptospiraceae bacterium]|nr:single-stranded DNA-binding protein [Leptospiraceae bacterium]
MNNLSIVILDGNLTHDPELKEVGENRRVTRFTVAANHEYGGNTEKKFVSYFQVECWDKLADNCSRYLRKGSRVTVTGNLRQDRWQDERGQNRSKIKINANHVRFDYTPSQKDNDEQAA